MLEKILIIIIRPLPYGNIPYAEETSKSSTLRLQNTGIREAFCLMQNCVFFPQSCHRMPLFFCFALQGDVFSQALHKQVATIKSQCLKEEDFQTPLLSAEFCLQSLAVTVFN